MKRELIIVLIGSLILAAMYRIIWGFPFKLMVMTTLLVNFSVLIFMWYSERIQRPLLFQAIVSLYLGITGYCLLSVNETSLFGAYYDGALLARLSLILLFGSVFVILVGIRPLIKLTKGRIDAWIPPLWPVAIIGVISYISVKGFNTETYRMGVLIGTGAIVAVTAYKNNHVQDKTIDYKISTRYYLRYLMLFSILVLLVTNIVPHVSKLPGTNLIKKLTNNWGNGIVGDIQTEAKLDRNPSQSEEVILQVESEGAVYLRKMAYSTYKDGVWSIEEGDEALQQMEPVQWGTQYQLFEDILDGIEDGTISDKEAYDYYADALKLPKSEVVSKSAYLQEKGDIDYYFTINGTSGLEVAAESEVGYYDDVDNLFFAPMGKDVDIAYTINYNNYLPKEGTREYTALCKTGVKEYYRLLDIYNITYKEKSEEIAYLMGECKDALSLYEKYTQIPEEVNDEIIVYAYNTVEGCYGDIEKAQAICDQLKKSGIYTYKLGASYVDEANDPVVDFLKYGGEGICQDFASGMTLMCRSIGLPARYVTGYYSIERSDDLEMGYDVRIKDAHAFVEVYISGYGWMLFDPTPYREDDIIGDDLFDDFTDNGGVGNYNFNLGDTKLFILVVVVILAILLWIYPLAYVREWLWKYLLLKQPSKRALTSLMNRTLKLLAEHNEGLKNQETLAQLAKRLNDKGVDITPITKPFEACYYGNKVISTAEVEKAILCYKLLKKRSTVKKLNSV